jgi:putative ABC transport system permease protein
MLTLKKITKVYNTSGFKQKALDNVSINFRENEFVSILGPSGSGKTTLLNIIGGLDNYTDGDLIINGKSTKKYKDRDWDTYRNHRVGFVFQSYNLIPHQTALANVELALTLSGVSKREREKRAKEVLKKVGLGKHINKRPNQMSGGQMQRVAIARALINDPDILLADEPTGALDSETSVQIMNLLKEIAREKLVIMVTHNPDLAKEYSTRIVRVLDGKIIDDSNYFDGKDDKIEAKEDKKTSMSFRTALSLSVSNLLTKKGRTILTSFAGAIGIIGIALILSLSNGIQRYIDRVEEDTLSTYPITIEEASIDSSSLIESLIGEGKDEEDRELDKIYSSNIMGDMFTSITSKINTNDLKSFKEYLDSDDTNIKDYVTDIQYSYNVTMNLYKEDTSNGIVQVNPNTVLETIGMGDTSGSYSNMITSSSVFEELMNNQSLLESQYDVIAGKWPSNYDEMVLIVNDKNEITDYTLYALGILSQDDLKEEFNKMIKGEEVSFSESSYSYSELLDLKYKLVLNTDYYQKEGGIWVDKSNDLEYLKKIVDNGIELKIVGIVRPNEESVSAFGSSEAGIIGYTHELTEYLINKINESEIASEQLNNKNINVFTNSEFTENSSFDIDDLTMEQKSYLAGLSETELADFISNYTLNMGSSYEDNLEKLGIVSLDSPSSINIYPKDFDSKEEITKIIEEYNKKVTSSGNDSLVITYTDLVGVMMKSVTSIVNVISYVLIAFVSISLIVSSIMIGIITYISVLERTKEIGILRAMGASKKDISRVFNAETFIEGAVSGVLGIVVTLLLNIPINIIIKKLVNISGIASLPVVGAIVLILISMGLTVVAGLIPSKFASRKDPVEALRTE